jgi:hypothetical protein
MSINPSGPDMALGLALAVSCLPLDDMFREYFEASAKNGVVDPSETPRGQLLRALLEVKRVVERMEKEL